MLFVLYKHRESITYVKFPLHFDSFVVIKLWWDCKYKKCILLWLKCRINTSVWLGDLLFGACLLLPSFSQFLSSSKASGFQEFFKRALGWLKVIWKNGEISQKLEHPQNLQLLRVVNPPVHFKLNVKNINLTEKLRGAPTIRNFRCCVLVWEWKSCSF